MGFVQTSELYATEFQRAPQSHFLPICRAYGEDFGKKQAFCTRGSSCWNYDVYHYIKRQGKVYLLDLQMCHGGHKSQGWFLNVAKKMKKKERKINKGRASCRASELSRPRTCALQEATRHHGHPVTPSLTPQLLSKQQPVPFSTAPEPSSALWDE